jgi:NAD-specific glutamate dehydrogenase
MTDEVAALVLRDNYFQTQVLSHHAAPWARACSTQQARFIHYLEKRAG